MKCVYSKSKQRKNQMRKTNIKLEKNKKKRTTKLVHRKKN